MRVQLQASPFTPPIKDYILTERVSIISIIEQCNDMEWAKEFVHVMLNGVLIPPCWWRHVTVKPYDNGLLSICIVQQKGKVIPLLASVALIALTAGIGTFGVPFLGAGFSAGSFGASAVAAGFGLAGQLAINALTAPPSVRQNNTKQRLNSQAGISANQLAPLELLPTIHGEIVASPPLLVPAYTTFADDKITVHGMVGVQGRNQITEVRVNGTDVADVEGFEYETREGASGDTPPTIAMDFVIPQTEQMALSNWDTRLERNKNDALTHQTDPDRDKPKFAQRKTKGPCTEFRMRFLMPSGGVSTADGDSIMVPLRIQIRKVGDSAWRNFPTLNVVDTRNGNGPLRFEVRAKFQRPPAGIMFSYAADEFPIMEATSVTMRGLSPGEYFADAYFGDGTINPLLGVTPDFTGNTTGAWTVSATSGANPWRLFDQDVTQEWNPGNNSLPCTVELTGPATFTASYKISNDAANPEDVGGTNLTRWEFWVTANGVDWVKDHEMDFREIPLKSYVIQIANPGTYVGWRWVLLENNGAGSEALDMEEFYLYADDAYGSVLTSSTAGGGMNGDVATFVGSPQAVRSQYVNLHKDGADIYLDPASWDPYAQWEVRVQRGGAVDAGAFTPWNMNSAADYFEYRLDGSVYKIRNSQRDLRSDIVWESFDTVDDTLAPIDTKGISLIAFRMEGADVNSIAARFKSYARIFTDGVWADEETPTSNPAALYRRLLMGHAHPKPQPPELINDDVLIEWYNRCVANGYECNYMQQGGNIAEVKGVISYTGFASPQESEKIGVIEDYDRSGEPISQMLTPLNSRLLGEVFPMPDVEHGIIAEFLDEDNEYKVSRPIIYREGYNALNASIFITVRYDGFTNLAKVTERAEFDLMQSSLRAATVQVEVDIEGYTFPRGKLLGHTDDVIDEHSHYGLISAINTVGPNVVSIEVNQKVPFTEMLAGLDPDLDGIDPTNPFGAAIRLANGTSVVEVITNTTDSSTITFLTPFTFAGSGLAVQQMVSFGIVGKEFRRMIVMGSKPQGTDKRVLTLAPEANELFQ